MNDETEYNHYKEEGWDVWERKGEHSLTSTSSISKLPLPIVDYYKFAHLFVRQLNASQLVDKYFTFGDMQFVYIYLTGTVVSKTSHRDKLSLEVHDGTDSITCLLEDELLNKIEKEKQDLNNTKADYTNSSENNSAIFQASLINFKATQNLFKRVPSRADLQPGNIVALSGKLTEHNTKKYVFVSKINAASIEEHLTNLQDIHKNGS